MIAAGWGSNMQTCEWQPEFQIVDGEIRQRTPCQMWQGGGKGSSPPPPDYAGAARAQGAANVDTARIEGKMNNPNITNPYGQQTVTWNGDQPNVTQTLVPAQQNLLDSQNRISQNLANVGEAGLNRVGSALDTPFNTSGLNPIQTGSGTNAPIQSQLNIDQQARQHAEDSAYQAATSRLDPQWNQAGAQQETQLRNQGLVPGGEAYDNAMRVFTQGKNDAYQQAQSNAVNQGLTNQQAQFNMGLNQGQFANSAAGQQFSQGLANAQFGNQATQQQIQQQAYLRSLPLNELNALRTGSQVQNPTFQQYQGSNVAPPNIAGAAAQQGAWDQNSYSQQVGSQNAMTSGLFSIGAAAAPFIFSDRRLKTNIVMIGTDPRGFNIYEYDIFNNHVTGVMADEVEEIIPEVVMTDPNGWKMVDYGRLQCPM